LRLSKGKRSPSGFVVKEILGQGARACVYTTDDDQLRWEYDDDGVLPDSVKPLIHRFDVLMSRIAALPDIGDRRRLYALLGKTLALALNAKKLARTDAFIGIEHRLDEIAAQQVRTSLADLAIICALHQPELSSVLSAGEWSPGPILPDDPQVYHSSTWLTESEERVRVVAAAPNFMGLTATAALTAKIILQFRPKMVAMAGIAAGSKSTTQGFGDLLVPDQTFDHGSAKTVLVKGKLQLVPNPNPLHIGARLLGKLKEWQQDGNWPREIEQAWLGTKPRTRLAMHVGPLFSSSTVLDAEGPMTEVISHWRKLVGAEMEAHAAHRACNDTIEPAPVFLCAKSICDFASGKSDDWQRYAAFTSARFLKQFIVKEWSAITHVKARSA
jgi:nucleoside phosphorylase